MRNTVHLLTACPGPGRDRRRGQPPTGVRGARRRARRAVCPAAV